MSSYEKKGTSRKGNNRKTGQAHQNTTAWKPNKNSKKTREINALPVYGLCQRCTDVIMWRKKYRKYKPLTALKKCTGCQEKAIKEAYHVLCNNCASDKKVCAKCLESKEIITNKEDIKTNEDEVREQQEQERLLKMMPLRQQRSYLRKLAREEEVPHLNPEDFEDSDFDFGSDFDSEDEKEEENEQIDELTEKTKISLKV
ncbi:hypothetical protein INT45_003549 [Circinella minor]|uniref:Uncharacterized protein n=1 Tax=Circinella minor TaxID=1195481 RepID=A0A8H7S452_9FUNG|nr:hypothetical protein INT45_003549 [Circinella minor]